MHDDELWASRDYRIMAREHHLPWMQTAPGFVDRRGVLHLTVVKYGIHPGQPNERSTRCGYFDPPDQRFAVELGHIAVCVTCARDKLASATLERLGVGS